MNNTVSNRLSIWTICLTVLLFVLAIYGVYENHYHFNSPANCIESATNSYTDIAIFLVGLGALAFAVVGAISNRRHKAGLIRFIIYSVVVLAILITANYNISYTQGC